MSMNKKETVSLHGDNSCHRLRRCQTIDRVEQQQVTDASGVNLNLKNNQHNPKEIR